MAEERAILHLVSDDDEESMPRLKLKEQHIEEADTDISESGQLTWIYRGMISFLVLVVLGMVGWEGQNISTSVGQVKTDINSLRNDVGIQIGSLKTDYATNAVVLMNLQQQLGEDNGKLAANNDRFNRMADLINAVRDRLTVLETKYDDHVKTKE